MKNENNTSEYKNYDAWILIIIPVGALFWFYLNTLMNDSDAGLGDWVPLIILSAAILYFWNLWYNGFVSKCPKCKKWFVRKSNGTEGYSSHTYNTTKTVSDVVRNSKGEQIGTVERKVPITMRSSSWTEKWRCVNCKHTWDTRNYSTSEV